MSAPGASRSSADPPFEKQVTWSAAVCASVQTLGKETGPRELSYTAPTAITPETQAGAAIEVAEALFPALATTVTPRARSVATAEAKASVEAVAASHVPEKS